MSETTTANTEKVTVKLKDRKMNKLENLVPPPELCKLIPAGEFEDSAMYWGYLFGVADVFPRECGDCATFGVIQTERYICPAPTLQEILAALPPYGKNEQILACCVPDWADFDARVFGEHWRVGYTGNCSINDKNPAAAALKLWLKLKGIENE